MWRLIVHSLFAFCFAWLLTHAELTLYLSKISYGQMNLLLHTQKVSEVIQRSDISEEEKKALQEIENIKKYSVDSLSYKKTNNYTTFYNQYHQPILWLVTACEPFSFTSYKWSFPVVGTVSYKGFFTRGAAQKEFYKIDAQGYDAAISEVSAWSTLGWLPDPILSSMLQKSKGRMADLFFHELFHATYYAPGTVEVNENLANFIAEKATLQFFKYDTLERNKYIQILQDDSVYTDFTLRAYDTLRSFFVASVKENKAHRLHKKKKLLQEIYKRSLHLPLHQPIRYREYSKQILIDKNTFFMDIHRYNGLRDSLNTVLEHQYRGNLKKMIEALSNATFSNASK
ncbi:MAG: aminopeptidase [Bacteroidetes bacterium]|nr:aminopeptidase [Bacteroidota bacterium]